MSLWYYSFGFVVGSAVLLFWLHYWLCGFAVLVPGSTDVSAVSAVSDSLLSLLRFCSFLASLLSVRFCGSGSVVVSADLDSDSLLSMRFCGFASLLSLRFCCFDFFVVFFAVSTVLDSRIHCCPYGSAVLTLLLSLRFCGFGFVVVYYAVWRYCGFDFIR